MQPQVFVGWNRLVWLAYSTLHLVKYKNAYNIHALDQWYLKWFNCLEAMNVQVTCSFILFKFRDFPWLFRDLFPFSMNWDIAVTFDNFPNSTKLFLFLFSFSFFYLNRFNRQTLVSTTTCVVCTTINYFSLKLHVLALTSPVTNLSNLTSINF